MYISPEEAREVLGEFATRLDGLTFMSWDASQFMNVRLSSHHISLRLTRWPT